MYSSLFPHPPPPFSFHLCNYEAVFSAILQLSLLLSISISLRSPLHRPSIMLHWITWMERAIRKKGGGGAEVKGFCWDYLFNLPISPTGIKNSPPFPACWCPEQASRCVYTMRILFQTSVSIITYERVHVDVLPGHVIVTDQQQVLHQGQEVVLSFGVLHCVD